MPREVGRVITVASKHWFEIEAVRVHAVDRHGEGAELHFTFITMMLPPNRSVYMIDLTPLAVLRGVERETAFAVNMESVRTVIAADPTRISTYNDSSPSELFELITKHPRWVVPNTVVSELKRRT